MIGNSEDEEVEEDESVSGDHHEAAPVVVPVVSKLGDKDELLVIASVIGRADDKLLVGTTSVIGRAVDETVGTIVESADDATCDKAGAALVIGNALKGEGVTSDAVDGVVDSTESVVDTFSVEIDSSAVAVEFSSEVFGFNTNEGSPDGVVVDSVLEVGLKFVVSAISDGIS